MRHSDADEQWESRQNVAFTPHRKVGAPLVIVQIEADAFGEARSLLAERHEVPAWGATSGLSWGSIVNCGPSDSVSQAAVAA